MADRMENVPSLLMEESEWQEYVALNTMKRNIRSKKMEFVGWGSKPLIDFLASIGKDTKEPLSHYDVTAVINEYVHENKLLHPVNKKKILCDAKLQFVFGKKSVNRNKIYELLEAHFAENQELSEEDEFGVNLQVVEDNVPKPCKRQKKLGSERICWNEGILEAPRSGFASVNVKNVSLVYLRKSLIEDLSKHPETFEGKVLGSFVRVKSDPKDYLQRNSHQLLQVTGTKKTSKIDDIGSEILLQVSNLKKDIHICMLSDDDFTEEECEDLNQRVKDGLLKRPTVLELEEKARSLHEDITKNRITREIALLQNLIDRANEKGWRAQLCEYLERKLLLQTTSEQLRLLQEVPKVIADEIELKDISLDFSKVITQGHDSSLKTILGASEIPLNNYAKNGTTFSLTFDQRDDAGIGDTINENGAAELTISDYSGLQGVNKDVTGSAAKKEGMGVEEKQLQPGAFIPEEEQLQSDAPASEEKFLPSDVSFELQYQSDITINEEQSDILIHETPHNSQAHVEEESQEIGNQSNADLDETRGIEELLNEQKVSEVQIIDLSDNDDNASDTTTNQILEDPDSSIWYYVDPFGDTQGPFSLSMLKRWRDTNYFGPGFKVWRTGQSQEAAILLTDALCSMSHKGKLKLDDS